MREIKFRAWDGKRMTTSGIMFNNTTSCLEVPIGSQMKLMQYTGLKDKNGKEIYEGDVVKADWHWEEGRVVDLSYESNFFYAISEYCLEDVLKIIGNIYENPELL